MIVPNMCSEFAGITKALAICLALLLAAFLAATVAQAQETSYKFELTPFAGLTTGGDFEDLTSTAELSLDDSSSFGLILNIEESANTQWEFLYSLQATEADTTGLPISGAPRYPSGPTNSN